MILNRQLIHRRYVTINPWEQGLSNVSESCRIVILLVVHALKEKESFYEFSLDHLNY